MAVLVLAAVREELGPLEGETVGVGPIVAAASAVRRLEARRPDRVVLVGSCGAYPGGPRGGTAVVSRRFGLSHGVAALGLGYVPLAPAPIPADPEMLATLAQLGCAVADVLTVGAISTDPTLVEALADGWDVEHMESYAVALACREAGIPFVAVLGVANEVGPQAHVQWLTHRNAAQQAARDAATGLLG